MVLCAPVCSLVCNSKLAIRHQPHSLRKTLAGSLWAARQAWVRTAEQSDAEHENGGDDERPRAEQLPRV